MFKAVLSDPKILKDSIDTVAQLIEEGLFKVNSNGIELVAADRAMVSVIELNISAAAFDSFESDKEESFGVNILNFLSILKRAGNEDKLTLSLNGNKLEIIIKGASERSFVMPLIDISVEDVPPVKQLRFSASALLDSSIIAAGIEDASIVADSVIIQIVDSKLNMAAEGDSSKVELKLEKGSPSLFELSAEGPAESRYPLEYLRKMMNASKLADRVKVNLAKDYPLRLEFNGDKAKISFILAPRVSEE